MNSNQLGRKRKDVSYKELSKKDIEADSDDSLGVEKPSKKATDTRAAKAATSTHVYTGRAVTKEFPPHGKFSGTVTSYDEDEELWKVTYLDGDEEEFTTEELKPLLDPPAAAAAATAATPAPNAGKKTKTGAASALVSTVEKQKKSVSAAAGKGGAGAEASSSWILMEGSDPVRGDGGGESRELGRYPSEKAAVAAAKKARDRDCNFEGWAEDHYGDDPPPYWSGDGENYDNDEWVTLRLVSPAQQRSAAAKRDAANARATASKPPPKPATALATLPTSSSSSSSSSGGGGGGGGSGGRRSFGEVEGGKKPAADSGLFCRNRCPLQGAVAVETSKYPGSGQDGMLYRVQRNSDRNYAMRAVCLDGAGARYVSYKRKHVYNKIVNWLPPTNLNDHSADPNIVDGCHAALLVPDELQRTTHSVLTSQALLSAVTPATNCLFLNCYSNAGEGFQCPGFDPEAVPQAVSKAGQALQCLAVTEGPVGKSLLEALSGHCPNLKGLMLDSCTVPVVSQDPSSSSSSSSYARKVPDEAETPNDALLAAVLRHCPKLEWLYVDIADGHFGDMCWRALADNCCPNLTVLWVDSVGRGPNLGASFGSPALVRAAAGSGSPLAGHRDGVGGHSGPLKLLMVNPDKNALSRFVLHGAPGGRGAKKADRLEGEKSKPEPEFSRYDFF